MSSRYLLLRGLEVSDCNLETSHLTVSFPLTALAGFCEKLIDDVRGTFAPDRQHYLGTFRSFIVCVHSYQQYEGHTKNPLALCKGNGGSPNEADLLNPPIVTEIKGRVRFSVAVELQDAEPGFFDDAFETTLLDKLSTLRFAGGEIFLTQTGGRFRARRKSSSIAPPGGESLFDELARFERGWFIKDRSDLIVNEEDKLATLMDALSWEREDERPVRRHSGWLWATCTGYQLLETPTRRLGQRSDAHLHAFAEPVHGLVELISSGALRRLGRDNSVNKIDWLRENGFCWKWEVPSDRTYCVLTAY